MKGGGGCGKIWRDFLWKTCLLPSAVPPVHSCGGTAAVGPLPAAAVRGPAPQDGLDRYGLGSRQRIRPAAWSARPPVRLPGPLMRPYRSSALFQNLTSASLPPSGGGFRATGEVQTERRGSMTRSTTRPASYPVRLAGAGPVTIMPDSGGATFRGGRDPSGMNGAASCGEPGPCTVTRPARVPRRPRRAARVFRCSVVPLPSRSQACDRTAPSGTRPVVANLHSATRSLRASATIPRLRERPSRALT